MEISFFFLCTFYFLQFASIPLLFCLLACSGLCQYYGIFSGTRGPCLLLRLPGAASEILLEALLIWTMHLDLGLLCRMSDRLFPGPISCV